MKKIMIFAAVAAMFSLASCQKDEVVANNEVKGSPVFTAVINSESTKTTVAIDGNKGKISWEQTDEITITDSSTPTPKTAVYKVKSIDETTRKATFEIKSGETALGAGPYTATYGVAQPTYQTYSASAPASAKLYMEAPSTATKEFVFDVKCGIMKLNLSKSGETITHIAVTGTPTGGTKKTYTMYCPGGVDISSGKDFFIALPAGSYDKIEVYKYDATNGFKVYSPSSSTPIAVSDNHIKPVNASGTTIDFSKCQNLPGVFSVSNDNGTTIKQVRFSQGNLYAKKDEGTADSPAWKWHFYDEQYKYNLLNSNCDASGNRTATNTDTEIDLFTWGYDATTSVMPTGAYHVDGHAEGFKQLNNYTGGDDWGVAYCESNNIDVGTWRTLSKDEWTYLFYTRSNASNLYKGGVTVCGKTNCVVLLPDDWQWDTNTVGTDWQTEYPETSTESNPVTWEKMEKAGAVCLPAAGSRNGADVYSVGVLGYCWSSTAYDSDKAYYVYFSSSNVGPDGSDDRSHGISVRLITECQ